MNEPSDPNAPLRGPTFAVVAPTVGVVVVLIVLALRGCAPSGPEDETQQEDGRFEAPAAFELAGRGWPIGDAIS